MRAKSARLLNLGLFECNVLAGNRIVLAEADLVRRRARVLLGDIEETGACRAEQLDFLGNGFGHVFPALSRERHTVGAHSIRSFLLVKIGVEGDQVAVKVAVPTMIKGYRFV